MKALVRAVGRQRDSLHQKVATDKGSLPGFAHSAEYLFTVTPAARFVNTDFEREQLLRDAGPEVGIVRRDASLCRSETRTCPAHNVLLGLKPACSSWGQAAYLPGRPGLP
jgi:hypothetical protein